MPLLRILRPAAVAVALTAGLPAGADELRYELPLPPHQRIGYVIDFEVAHAGPLELSAEWPGLRVLSFRLEEVGSPATPFRLSGPSPQSFTVEVPNPGDIPRAYRLHIRGLANREDGVGLLIVQRPEAAPPPPPLLEDLPPATPPPVAWSEVPPGAPASWKRFSAAADVFSDAVARDPRGDACRWQAGLAAFLDAERDALVQGEGAPAPETLATLDDIVEMVRRVEALRTTTDPALAGPPPRKAAAHKQWTREREERLRVVEAELDGLLNAIERGHAPDLARQPWPYRLVSCVVGCERHFEERVRVGEKDAVNRQLAADQWDRLLEAADLLELLTELAGDPASTPAP